MLAAISPPEVGRLFAVTTHQLREERERARGLAGLPAFRFHDARHAFAQPLDDAGLGDVTTDALHHADPRLRRRCSRVREERVKAAMD